MPTVYLTNRQRAEAKERREIGTLTERMHTARLRLGVQEQDIASSLGLSKSGYSQLKRAGAAEKLPLLKARRIAHAVGCTAEDWLRIGGFM